MSILLKEIKTEDEALEILAIRNQCASFMTGNSKYLTIEEQLQWFAGSVMPSRRQSPRGLYAFLVKNVGGETIGYAIARQKEDEKWWLTAGLKEEFRGQGYGKDTFRHLNNLVRFYAKEAWLDVLTSNTVAHNLYTKLGFREMARTDTIITMRKEL